jgi:DNA polymerase
LRGNEYDTLKSALPNERRRSAPIAQAQEILERFAPPPEMFKKKTEPAVPNSPSAPASRLGLLERTKLSNVNVPRPEPMPVKPVISMPTPTPIEEDPNKSLFGDITKSLPPSSETIVAVRAEIGNCTRCPLHEGRIQVVHSTGNQQADLMFIGEAPGADEDQKGEPFVGRAGQLLTKIIEAIQIKREDVFIGNINRCRPPGNRAPTLPEAHTCRPYLLREIAIVRPKVIVVMGNTACQNLLDTKVGITKLRGSFQDYYGIKVMPTFHPAYLLRDPSKKREVWEDMKTVRAYLSKES